MYDNKSFIEDGIIHDTIYGCIKQYRYSNSMWLLFVLAFTFRLILYRYINAPGNEKIK